MKKLPVFLTLFSLGFLTLFFPKRASSQNIRPVARLATSGGDTTTNTAAPAAGSPLPASAFNTDFMMKPSVTSTSISPYGAGPQTLALEVLCVNLLDGTIIPNAVITVVPSAEENSGGHLHNTNRPAGSFSPDHGNTGPSGILPVTYTAPEASGITDMVETCTVNGGPPATAIFTIGIEIDGLAAVNIIGFIVDTQSNMHGNNNGNATPATGSALGQMADLFVNSLKIAGEPVPALTITALSLPQGGLFDYSTEWSPPHKLHRNGTDADISPVADLTEIQKRFLVEAFKRSGFRAPVPGERPEDIGADHWHLKARGGA